ncbi:MAG: adenylate/guanylate cyclase domain-containing protein [Elusimicrobia bacterium]|nr:adenylate/guanylate cyclase domain-containing protein [Elusimicrobiota bacterium]
MSSTKEKFPPLLLKAMLSFTVLMAAVFWLMPWLYTRPENKISDFTVDFFSAREGDQRISIIAVTDEAMEKYSYPLPRGYYARAIDRLKKLGVKTVVFDILFLEKRDPAQDRELIRATREAGNVVQALAIQPAFVEGAVLSEKKMPIDGLAEASYLTASVSVDSTLDQDGYIRRVMLFSDADGGVYDSPLGSGCGDCVNLPIPSLSAAAYAHFTGTPLRRLYERENGNFQRWLNFTAERVAEASPGRKDKPRKEFYQSLYPQISIVDLLENTLSDEEKERLSGGVAFIASTALGAAYDQYPSPFQAQTPGVMFHANSLDNLLNGNFLRLADSRWMFAGMLLFIWLPVLWFRSAGWVLASVTVGLLALWSLTYAFLYAGGVKAMYVMPAAGLLGSFVMLTVLRVAIEGREKKWIKDTFSQYLSPKVVDVLVRDPERLKLGGDKRDMTVLFLDIAHFTTISEKLDPEDLTNFLNRYFSALTNVILKNDGVVDKYIGDCIMAFWNAPLDVPGHRKLGCLSAIECQEAIRRLNGDIKGAGLPEIGIRIGVNSGPMVVGNMGSDTRFSYTVIGDAVNLASRLEGANKYFGSSIMVTEPVYEDSKEAAEFRPLGRVRVVGKTVPISVYEPLALKDGLDAARRAMLDSYLKGYDLFYKRDFAGAAGAFAAALEAVPDDGPSKYYLANSRACAQTPPGQDWNGVCSLDSK